MYLDVRSVESVLKIHALFKPPGKDFLTQVKVDLISKSSWHKITREAGTTPVNHIKKLNFFPSARRGYPNALSSTA